jgi:hypothetical protein
MLWNGGLPRWQLVCNLMSSSSYKRLPRFGNACNSWRKMRNWNWQALNTTLPPRRSQVPTTLALNTKVMFRDPAESQHIIWLVVYLPLWKMMEFVSWNDEIPNMEKLKNPNHHFKSFILHDSWSSFILSAQRYPRWRSSPFGSDHAPAAPRWARGFIPTTGLNWVMMWKLVPITRVTSIIQQMDYTTVPNDSKA